MSIDVWSPFTQPGLLFCWERKEIRQFEDKRAVWQNCYGRWPIKVLTSQDVRTGREQEELIKKDVLLDLGFKRSVFVLQWLHIKEFSYFSPGHVGDLPPGERENSLKKHFHVLLNFRVVEDLTGSRQDRTYCVPGTVPDYLILVTM